MKKARILFAFVLSWLAAVPATRAQYHCDVLIPGQIHNDTLWLVNNFLAFSHYGDVFTAAGIESRNPGPNGEVRIIFQHSTDGGRTWQRQDPGIKLWAESNNFVKQVQQIDAFNAVMIGDTGRVLRTTDGGSTWHQQLLPSYATFPLSVDFSNANEGIMLVGDTVRKGVAVFITSDGGQHWIEAPFFGHYLEQAKSYGGGKFRLFKNGWVTFYTTHDYFRTVDSTKQVFDTLVKINGHVRFLGACAFGPGDTILAYGEDGLNSVARGLIWRTTDAGKNWSEILDIDDSLGEILCISDINQDTIIAARLSAVSKILISTDRGLTWKMDTLMFDSLDALHPEINAVWSSGAALNSSNDLVGVFGSLRNSIIYGKPVSQASVQRKPSTLEAVSVFPDPCTTTLHVDMSRSTLTIFDALGRSYTVPNHEGTLDVFSLPAGVYYVSDGKQRARFVKE